MEMIIAIFKIFWDLLKPFLIIILILTIIHIIYCQIKYKNVFAPFKKRPKKDERKELILSIIDKIPQYKKIICLQNLNSQILMISESGIYLFETFWANGIIEGDLNNKFLKVKHVNYSNPFLKIEEDYKKIISIFPDLNVKKYVIINDECLINKKVNNISIISLSKFYFKIEKDIKNKVMSKDEVDKLYKELINNNLN